MMNYEEYIRLGLDGEAPLKIIMRGSVEEDNDSKVGVVAIVFATTDKVAAEKRINELISAKNPGVYYMVYSVPLNTDLTTYGHYPSISISKEDLN